MSLVMQDDHAEFFRQHFRLGPDGKIPNAVVDLYWRAKRLADSASLFLDHRDLMWVALLSKHPLPSDAYSFLKTIEQREVEFGANVVCVWRKGKKPGVFHGVSGNDEVLVVLDGESEVRPFDPAEVTLANDSMVPSN